MSYITRFFDRRKVWKLLPDYPVYTPPHKGGLEKKDWMKPQQVQENYEFFLQEKDKRIQYLAEFLAHFDVKLELTDDGLVGLSQWMYRYGAYLRDTKKYRYESVEAYSNHHMRWDGDLAGLNIINDVSVFSGECIILYNKDANWFLQSIKTKNNQQLYGSGMPWVGGMKHWDEVEKIYIHGEIDECVNHRWHFIFDGGGSPSFWHDPLSLARIIRYYASNEVDPVRPDYPEGWDGPLAWFGKGPPLPPSRVAALKQLDAVSKLKPIN
jgi:hypothetical protein